MGDFVQLADGRHVGKITGCDVYTKDNGVTVARFSVDIGGMERKAFCCLTRKGGAPNEYTISTLEKVFPQWDGGEDWLQENAKGAAVACGVLNEKSAGSDRTWSNIKELYPLNQDEQAELAGRTEEVENKDIAEQMPF